MELTVVAEAALPCLQIPTPQPFWSITFIPTEPLAMVQRVRETLETVRRARI
jgi:hypothetical protein